LNYIDLTGQRFNRVTVKGRNPINKITPNGNNKPRWDCVCDCGKNFTTQGASLRYGVTQSCGCLKEEDKVRLSNLNRSHSLSKTYWFRIFHQEKNRCNNPRNRAYKDYGGRGIRFLFTSLEQFVAELGERPTPKHTVDRINNNGHYEPGNVRYATWEQQANNQRHKRLDKRRGYSSTFQGVFWHTAKGKWVVRMSVNGRLKQFGSFPATRDGEIKAALRYDAVATKYRGSEAIVNFPLQRQEAA